MGRWNRNYRQRKQLMEISGFLLKDMGITKTDLRREIQKPFWKD
ncbi:putative conserved small protein [Gynuella sunshinyii YC6258]|uniref:Putative conserved small protein n=1 Tax=Gynuella sunshinyii YC6258 TaxID=1445510 RepID=A0A0C5V4T7_9GAMM|nr:putative conserved small protein [Gynuella sunshinyii YC6258]